METILLVLESVLLVFTIILLFYSIKEGKEREAMIMEVGKATKILTRQEYFLAVTDSMMDAKEEVLGCITGSLPKTEEQKRTKEIVNKIERLVSSGVKVRYLIPMFPDRLHIGFLYTRAGAEVKYSNCLVVHDLRYIVVDDALVVMGIPEGAGDKEATRKGYRIPSEGLADILRDYFLQCWDKSTGYEDYVRALLKQTGAAPRQLAREFQIDEKELERLARESSSISTA